MKKELLQQQHKQTDILRQSLSTRLDQVKPKEGVTVRREKDMMELALDTVSLCILVFAIPTFATGLELQSEVSQIISQNTLYSCTV